MYDSLRISHTLTKLTSIYRQGWDNDLEGRKIRVVPRESLDMKKEKHRCYHEGKWSDREHPDSLLNPNWEFGIAYVTLNDANKRVDDAIKALNGTWYVSFEPPFTPILY